MWWTLLLLAGCPKPPPPPPAPAPLPARPAYPDAPRGDVVDAYYGTSVPDPYRWLEDLDSPATSAWVQANNALTRGVLDAIPFRDAVAERLAALWTFERWTAPVHRGETYVYEYNDGTWDQPRLYVSTALDAPGRTLIDTASLSADGTVSLAAWDPSEDGRWLAWGAAEAGSDWQVWKVRDVAKGVDLADELRWVKFSNIAWTADHRGFFYSRYPAPTTDNAMEERLGSQSLWYHRVGTSQAEDLLIVNRPDQPDWGFSASLSDDGARLVVTVTQGTERKNRLYWAPIAALALDKPASAKPGARAAGAVLRTPLDAFDATYTWVGDKGSTAWIYTDNGAPRYRLIAVDLDRPEPARWKTVIPEAEATLTGVHLAGGRFITTRLDRARASLEVFTTSGARVGAIDLPGVGAVGAVSTRAAHDEAFYTYSSFTTPPTVFRYSVSAGLSQPWKSPQVDFDPARYVTEQVDYPSKDGTMVPMFITRRRDATPDGANPTLLYGYGGFNIPMVPAFSVQNLMWLEMGGVYAVANLRGGGEFGREWHEAGTRCDKQNVFDDFIAAGEHLIRAGWTRPDRLGIHGRSNGGLLVGAALTQRPDLWGAALPGVGVLDMLRYHQFTIGWAWASDYGRSDDSEEMFRCLLAYSPVHNTREIAYPPTLVLTGDHDDRVVPGHSYKFAASLQHAQQGAEPVLIRVETRAGHGAGTPVSLLVDEVADRWSFLAWALDFKPTLPAR